MPAAAASRFTHLILTTGDARLHPLEFRLAAQNVHGRRIATRPTRLIGAENPSARLKPAHSQNRRTRMEFGHHRMLSSEYLRAFRDLYPIVGFAWIKPGPFHRLQTARFP